MPDVMHLLKIKAVPKRVYQALRHPKHPRLVDANSRIGSIRKKCPLLRSSNVLRVKVGNFEGGKAMSEFTFLYRGRDRSASPEKMQEIMQKWLVWFKDLGEKGHIKYPGHPLEDTGKVVRGNQKMVTDGPFAETKDIVGGFTLIEARDLEQAVELSKGCPILEDGGSVEVRPVRNMEAGATSKT